MKKYIFALAMAFFTTVCFGCANDDLSTKYSSELASESLTADTSATQTGKPSSKPSESVNKKNNKSDDTKRIVFPEFFGKGEFANIGFAIDTLSSDNSPYSGSIFSPLPDTTKVEIVVGWVDELEEVHELSAFFEVKDSRIDYSFTIDEIIPPQFFYLGAFLDLNDKSVENSPQIISMLGKGGANLPVDARRERSDGSFVMLNAWGVPFPNRSIAEQSVLDDVKNDFSDTFISAEWDISEGVFIVKSQNYEVLSNVEKNNFDAAIKRAAKAMRPHEGELDPIVIIKDESGNNISESGVHRVNFQVYDSVYVTEDGAKYHKQSCRYAIKAMQTPTFLAELRGYTPCKICHK